ncbi:MAG: pseudouridine synthase, partial [Roseburia sp.]|nr:pseudouridine synthase [Roseburia sp.]
AHSVKRVYRGIVSGRFRKTEGCVEGNIGRHPTDRKKMAVVPGGRSARTHYRVLEQYLNAAYMEFELETGRTHQIRVHMASIGHPLLGDTVYGNQKNPYHLQGQALHAMTIGFIHPGTGEYMEVSAPLPEYFQALMHRLDK